MADSRPRLLIGADILDARDAEIAADLAGDEDAVQAALERMDELFSEYVSVPHQPQS